MSTAGISTLSPGSIRGQKRRSRRGRGETTGWGRGCQDRVGVPLDIRRANPPGHLYQKVGQLASKSGLAETRRDKIPENLSSGMARRLNSGRRTPAGACLADGPRNPVSVRSFSKPAQVLGISPSFAFIEQPQTNGVAERFNRTLKEQVIYGRVFQNLEEVRTAVRHFVDTYDREWLVEKNGFKSPWQARAHWLAQASLARAA